jgi:hypothetical protein
MKNGSIEVMFQAKYHFREDIPSSKDVKLDVSRSFCIEIKNLEDFYQKIC